MADNKKYYYLRLKENFFETEELIFIESLPDGVLYSNILLKLYLKSLKTNGKLMLRDRIPYNSVVLASVVKQPVAVVESAIKIFKELGLVEILDNGAIYLSDIQSFIGKTSTEADRKRLYRDKIEGEKRLLASRADKAEQDKCPEDDRTNVQEVSDKCPESSGTNVRENADKNPPEIRDKSIEIDNKCSSCNLGNSKYINNAHAREQTNSDGKVNQTEQVKSGAVAEALALWQDNFGTLSPLLTDKVIDLVQDTGIAAFSKAVEKAVERNKRNFAYVRKVAIGIADGDDWDEKPWLGGKSKGKNDVAGAAEEAQRILESGELIDL